MNKKIWIISVLVLTLAVLGLTGCSTAGAQTTSTSNPPTNTSVAPVNVNVNNQEGIWVTGQGKVILTPDIAILNLGVSAQAAKVADAQSQAAAAMDKVMNVLKSIGIDTKDISTSSFSITPVTKYDNTTQQSTITGYQVSNLVNVKVRNINQTGAIIDAVAAAAGDLTRINSISFSVDNPERYYSQARDLAIDDAKAKAQQLATRTGVNLGKAFYIAENNTAIPYAVSSPIKDAVPAPTTSISPGQTEITLNVQVAYSIQ